MTFFVSRKFFAERYLENIQFYFFSKISQIWFQNRRYKTKRKQIQQHEAAILAATKRVVPVQVLVRDDANYCRMMSQNLSPAYPPSSIDPSLFSKLSLSDLYRQQV